MAQAARSGATPMASSTWDRPTLPDEQAEPDDTLEAALGDAVVFGDGVYRLCNTTCFALPGMAAETLLISLDLEGIAVSSGSACSSGKVGRSHVLEAMDVAPDLAACAIRASLGWNTTAADIGRFITTLNSLRARHLARRAA